MKVRRISIDSIYGNQVDFVAFDSMFDDIENIKAEKFNGFSFNYDKIRDCDTQEDGGERADFVSGLPLGLQPSDVIEMIKINKLSRLNDSIKSDKFVMLKQPSIEEISKQLAKATQAELLKLGVKL